MLSTEKCWERCLMWHGQCPMPRGRRRTIWLDVMKKQLLTHGMNYEQVKYEAQDREHWRAHCWRTRPVWEAIPVLSEDWSEERRKLMMMMMMIRHNMNWKTVNLLSLIKIKYSCNNIIWFIYSLSKKYNLDLIYIIYYKYIFVNVALRNYSPGRMRILTFISTLDAQLPLPNLQL